MPFPRAASAGCTTVGLRVVAVVGAGHALLWKIRLVPTGSPGRASTPQVTPCSKMEEQLRVMGTPSREGIL